MIHFMPPLPLVALLAWYWSSQVLKRCLPALRLEYFGSTAVGNTALPTAAGAAGAAGAAIGFGAGAGLASAVGAGAAGAAAGAAAGVASAPHCALRKSFHFMLAALPSALAALYLALHSLMLSASAGEAAVNAAKPDNATAQNKYFA